MSQKKAFETLPIFQTARRIVETVVRSGHEAYFAGGCVRDLLLGRTPVDIDIATSAHPDVVQSLFTNTFAKGKAFGVVSVLEEGHEFEVAAFRTEGKYSDGRRPDTVEFSDARSDVERRDFTVNGMLYDPLKREVIDYVGGEKDLSAKLIRAIGDPEKRFKEDKLRLMRAIRFACALDFEIESDTWRAVKSLGPLIVEVSMERVRDELLKMLSAPHPSRALRFLDDSSILLTILPEVASMKGVEQPPQFHPEGDVWVHTLLALDHLRSPSPELALGCLLHDVGKPPTARQAPDRIRFDFHVPVGAHIAERICRRLRLSSRQEKKVVSLVDQHLRFADAPKMKKSTLKRFLWQEKFEEHLELHRADCLASHSNLDCYEFSLRELERLRREESGKPPAPILTGDDLISLGLTPGPLFSQILTAVQDAQLEGDLSDTDAAKAFVKEKFKEHFAAKK